MSEDEKDITTMNTMMNAYSNNNFHEECVKLYKQINDKNVISHNIAIQSCGYINSVDDALNIFNSIEDKHKDIVTINMMMQVYIHNERSYDAVVLYEQIGKDKFEHIEKNEMSHNLVSKAYTKLNEYEKGKEIVDSIEINDDNIPLKNRLIDFYAHAHEIDDSLKVFDSIDDMKKDISTINVMLNGYVINEMNGECLKLFKNIETVKCNSKPDIISYQNVLQHWKRVNK